MAKITIGDIFEVPFEDGTKQYFQYVMEDSSLMNSDIIRAFDYQLDKNQELDINELLTKPIKFYTHMMVKGGLKLGMCVKIGDAPIESNFKNPMFKEHSDSGVKKSYTWYVWEPNKEMITIGELTDPYKSSYQGGIFHPLNVKDWLKTGTHGFFFPE